MTDTEDKMSAVLTAALQTAEAIESGAAPKDLPAILSDDERAVVIGMSAAHHAVRGASLTLAAYKVVMPDQDIRAHQQEMPGGFSARSFDTKVTVPFLMANQLHHNVETHWLTQAISYAPKLEPHVEISTSPKRMGPLYVRMASIIQDASEEQLRAIVALLMNGKVRERNRGRVTLTRPKGLSIDQLSWLLDSHFADGGSPRLPQLAMFAIYQCITRLVSRYAEFELDALERLKSADRKAGTVGDVVVSSDEGPIEAVEVKHNKAITLSDVNVAIEKSRAVSITRYYILSTSETYVTDQDEGDIQQQIDRFRKQNGCEIIVNGVQRTIRYYLRLLPNTDDFTFRYANQVETDEDVGYEQRNLWNELCAKL